MASESCSIADNVPSTAAETTWRKNDAILGKSADSDSDGDDRGIGGRDVVELQTTTAGRVAPGKGCVRMHPGGVRDGGGAEADTGRRQPVTGLPLREDDNDGTDDDREDDNG